ncbi:MarR family winged helix-turn-helix transcriptional regulator [Halomonas sp. GXIMD04776]|uniref:MarR family winged helix-turn-helix transcriptional regulator n=1 Tax=Halomonas sp. GXIMD04776 TaxID=3415605 RepID=UPI003C7F32C9
MTQDYTESGALFTDIALETFRLNGMLVAEGDRLTADLGLTSARWKVLGAIDIEERPLTVAQIARRMGLARQSVQRIVGELQKAGYITLSTNPDHKRSPFVERTIEGERIYAIVMARYVQWANRLAETLDREALAQTFAVLKQMSERLEDVPYLPERAASS